MIIRLWRLFPSPDYPPLHPPLSVSASIPLRPFYLIFSFLYPLHPLHVHLIFPFQFSPYVNLTSVPWVFSSMHLSRNQLSGNIPSGIGSLSFLAYISVAHNQLKGEIPRGPQFSGQAESSFEGNAGLCGLPLQGSCFALPTQQPKEEEEEEDEVISWKAVVIGYWPGLLFGLVIAHFIASFKQPQWFAKIVGPDKRKQVDPVRLFMTLDSRWDSFDKKNNVQQK